MGACLATKEAGKGMTAGIHGTTFGGNPLGMAVGNAVLDIVLAPGFLEHVRGIAGYARQQMAGLIAAHPNVFAELRGEGLMIGLKMKRAQHSNSSTRCAPITCWRSAPATMSCACCRR